MSETPPSQPQESDGLLSESSLQSPLQSEDRNGRGRTVPEGLTRRRRIMVARLLVRGLTAGEIHNELIDLELVHPDGNPFSLETVYCDLRFFRENRYEQSQQAVDAHRLRLLAENRELRRVAWQNADYSTILRSIKQEIELFGLNGPIKIETTADNRATVDEIADSMTIEQLRAIRDVRNLLRQREIERQ